MLASRESSRCPAIVLGKSFFCQVLDVCSPEEVSNASVSFVRLGSSTDFRNNKRRLLSRQRGKGALDNLPRAVVDAAQQRFPNAKMVKASKENENGQLQFEVSMDLKGKNIDVTLAADGKLVGIEQELAFEDLPKAVQNTLKAKFSKASYKLIESVTKVNDGKETLECYEVSLVTQGKKSFEVEIAENGTIKKTTEKSGKD
jgi:uncharacterized membrane protein YkoI